MTATPPVRLPGSAPTHLFGLVSGHREVIPTTRRHQIAAMTNPIEEAKIMTEITAA